MSQSRWTSVQDELIRHRYPTEGASESLCVAVGEHAWAVRHRAACLGVRVTHETIRAKKLSYNRRHKRAAL